VKADQYKANFSCCDFMNLVSATKKKRKNVCLKDLNQTTTKKNCFINIIFCTCFVVVVGCVVGCLNPQALKKIVF